VYLATSAFITPLCDRQLLAVPWAHPDVLLVRLTCGSCAVVLSGKRGSLEGARQIHAAVDCAASHLVAICEPEGLDQGHRFCTGTTQQRDRLLSADPPHLGLGPVFVSLLGASPHL
jgi:hypothetical protein